MKGRKEILQDLIASEQTACVLKIKLKSMRNPMITAVDRITDKKVVLRPTCLYGYRLRKRNITLVEIESIKRYNTRFDNPIFARLRCIRSHITELRHDLGAIGETNVSVGRHSATRAS